MSVLLLLAVTTVFTPPQASDDETNAIVVRRHDQAIALDVSDEFKRDARLRDLGIKLRVTGGTVTLDGNVPTYARRIRAERLIQQVHGVQEIVNRLRVERALLFAPRASKEAATPLSTSTTGMIEAEATVRIKGLVQLKTDDELIVRDFIEGSVETELDKSTDVTLDGEEVKPSVLDSGLLVIVEASKKGDKLIARTVEAFSPK